MKKLLIVEDSPQFRRLLVDLLKTYYDKIYECADGKDATPAYEKYKPDCVLMDLQLDKIDGLTATRFLKFLHPEAHVIIVTGYADPEIREQALEVGAEKLISKENVLELLNFISKN